MSHHTQEKTGLNLRSHLIRGTLGSMMLKTSHLGAALLLSIVMARLLGVEGFGVYVFCISLIQFFVIPAMLGGQHILVREVAAYQSQEAFQHLKGLLLRFRQLSITISICLALLAAGLGLWFYRDSPILIPFLAALLIIPFKALMELQGASLRGLRHVLLGQVAHTLYPTMVIVLVGGMFWLTRGNLDPAGALSAHVLSALVLVGAGYIVLQRALPEQTKQIPPKYDTHRWIKSVLPFIFLGGMQVLNKETPVVLLGILHEADQAGLYRVAERGAALVSFGLLAVNMTIAPTVSRMVSNGEYRRLQRLIHKSMLAILGFALPVALVLLLMGPWLLSIAFGQEYVPAYKPMAILCIGQLINSGMGSVALILNMAGLETITARGVAVAAAAGLVLHALLIPTWGIEGAAVAAVCSLATWNILLCVALYKKTGIISIYLPGLGRG